MMTTYGIETFLDAYLHNPAVPLAVFDDVFAAYVAAEQCNEELTIIVHPDHYYHCSFPREND